MRNAFLAVVIGLFTFGARSLPALEEEQRQLEKSPTKNKVGSVQRLFRFGRPEFRRHAFGWLV